MDTIFNYIEKNRHLFIDRLIDYLRQPSISAHGVGMDVVADYLVNWLDSLGFKAQLMQGDRFMVKTIRPFYTDDYFSFQTRAARTDLAAADGQLDRISVVPNPYIATATWEPRTLYATGRGDGRIEFKHLPAQCTLGIYTVTGALIKTLVKDSSPTDGSLAWDLVSDDAMDIAYGLYIFHVDAPRVGEHIGKFAVVK